MDVDQQFHTCRSGYRILASASYYGSYQQIPSLSVHCIAPLLCCLSISSVTTTSSSCPASVLLPQIIFSQILSQRLFSLITDHSVGLTSYLASHCHCLCGRVGAVYAEKLLLDLLTNQSSDWLTVWLSGPNMNIAVLKACQVKIFQTQTKRRDLMMRS